MDSSKKERQRRTMQRTNVKPQWTLDKWGRTIPGTNGHAEKGAKDGA